MSEGKHTPGPWFLLTNGGQQRIFTFNHVVAEVRKTSIDKHESRANAILIMSAPELLEALEQLSLGFTGRYADDPRSDDEIDAHREKWEGIAMALIAKAKGEA